MNKSNIYSLIILILLVGAFIGVSAFVSQREEIVEDPSLAPQGPILNGREGEPRPIVWSIFEFPTEEVAIRLIKMVGTEPARYELVRVISTATANTGSVSWVPGVGENPGDLFIEIGCVASTEPCTSKIIPASL